VPLRTHEILENGMQSELTGRGDKGSHSELPVLRAEVDATRTALAAITPSLQQHDPALLGQVTSGLDAFAATLDAMRGSDGSWPALDSLGSARQAALDGQLGELLETLSHVPVAMTPVGDTD
jgi:iron uptake system EfeUOB component EfeO/EfeM